MATSRAVNIEFIGSTMKKEDYLNIIRQNVASYVEKLVYEAIGYINRTMILSARVLMEWLLYRILKILSNPYINLIKSLWYYLENQKATENFLQRCLKSGLAG